MLDLEKVKEELNPFLIEHSLTLYEVIWVKEFGYQVLRVSIDQQGGINSDTLALVNDYLSEKLDLYEKELPDNYMLEVCSPGAEKTLRNEDEVLEAVGNKINCKCVDMDYEGILKSFDNGILSIEINVKGRKKVVSVDYKDVKKVRLAV